MIAGAALNRPGSQPGTASNRKASRHARDPAQGQQPGRRSGASAIASVLVPGLGAGVGDMPPERSARQMRLAYDAIIGGAGVKPCNAVAIWGSHSDMLA